MVSKASDILKFATAPHCQNMVRIDIECGQNPTNQRRKLTSGNNMYNDKDNKHYLIIDNTMDFHSTIEHKELMYSIYDYI